VKRNIMKAAYSLAERYLAVSLLWCLADSQVSEENVKSDVQNDSCTFQYYIVQRENKR
jgi:hypothetical protein